MLCADAPVSLVAVAEGWRDRARTRGKIPGHRRMNFVRENPVRRVARPSLQFSGPTSECRRQAPTNEGCRRWCLVHLDASPQIVENSRCGEGRRGSDGSFGSFINSDFPTIRPAVPVRPSYIPQAIQPNGWPVLLAITNQNFRTNATLPPERLGSNEKLNLSLGVVPMKAS
jgi:hypothetical protein